MTTRSRYARLSIAVLMLGICHVAAADTITLKDGTTVQGTIVAEDDSEVTLRRSNPSGTIKYTEKYERSRIASIARQAEPTEPAASRPTTTRASEEDDDAEAVKSEAIKDKPRYLVSAIRMWEKKRWREAGIAFTKLINGSDEGELDTLTGLAEREASKTLAELAAESHFEYAMARARGTPIRISFATRYEAEPLARLLGDAYEAALDEEVSTRPKPREEAAPAPARAPTAERSTRSTRSRAPYGPPNRGTSRSPAEREPSYGPGREGSSATLRIRDWLDKPQDFNGTKEESRVFERHILYAMSLLDEWQKYAPPAKAAPAGDSAAPTDSAAPPDFAAPTDPQADKVADKDTIQKEHQKLEKLREAVAARFRGALTPDEKKEAADREREMLEKAAEQRRLEEQRNYIRQRAEHDRR